MIIELKKFGNMLISRETGREAIAAFLPILKSLGSNEEIKIDFQGVSVLTPSWADEFLRPLLGKYGKKISFLNDNNPSVKAALQFANPNLDLSEITVFEDQLVFNEKSDTKHYNEGKSWLVLTFPYNDEDALKILTNNQVKEIRVLPVAALSDARLDTVVGMLNHAGIKTVVKKTRKLP